MLEVMTNHLRSPPKPEGELQEDDIRARFVCTAAVFRSSAVGRHPIEFARSFVRRETIDELGQYIGPWEFLLERGVEQGTQVVL